MARHSKTSPRTSVTTQRRLEALQLRCQGLTHQQIADRLGISKPGAYQLIAGALADHSEAVKEAAEELRTITLMQLDALIHTHLNLATHDGSDKSANVVLKALAERSKLMGMYAPVKAELTGKDGGPLQSVQATAGIDLTALSTEQLASLESILSTAQAKQADS